MDQNEFKIYENRTQVGIPLPDDEYPSQISTWATTVHEFSQLRLPADATHYGFVQSGGLKIRCSSGDFDLRAGMYFAVPGEAELETSGKGFCATRLGYSGFFSLGGPIESQGRLTYIDGCSDSLLISPVLLGDPCLNLLYLPPNTRQTQHTHPSVRAGIIVDGCGTCRTPKQDTFLKPGMIFEIPPNAMHSFHTDDESLRVIAWHPDSDCGPAHNDHPMINRTIIDGKSAANLQD